MFYKDSFDNKYRIGTPFEYGGYYYAASQANHPKFMELGFTQVIVGSRPDSRFYSVAGPDINGQFTSNPRDLAQLKTSFIKKEKQNAHTRNMKP